VTPISEDSAMPDMGQNAGNPRGFRLAMAQIKIEWGRKEENLAADNLPVERLAHEPGWERLKSADVSD